MRLTRVYVDVPLHVDTRIRLPAAAAHHLLRVLRMQPDDACIVFNGDGHDYTAYLDAVGKHDAQVRIHTRHAADNESPLAITLVQAVARGDKMDWIVQKATELGVAAIVPVISERADVKLDGARADKRIAHWRSVAISACEQSGRARLPAMAALTALRDISGVLPATGTHLFLDPRATNTAANLARPVNASVVVAIGPEGGWSPQDMSVLAAQRFQGLRLGPRIVRTETAGLAAITALQAMHGDFR